MAGTFGGVTPHGRSIDTLALLLEDISRLRRLTAEEETECARIRDRGGAAEELLGILGCERHRQLAPPGADSELRRQQLLAEVRDGKAAVKRLVESGLRFATFLVLTEYRWTRIPPEDLVSASAEGLHTAAARYDYRLGFRFSTYASSWIKNAIWKAIEEERAIRVPVGLLKQIRRINDETARLVQEYSRDPTIDEVADRLGLDPRAVEQARKADSIAVVSLHAPVGEPATTEDQLSLEELLASGDPSVEDAAAAAAARAVLELAMAGLSPGDREMVAMIYLAKMGHRDIERIKEISNTVYRKRKERAELRLDAELRKLGGWTFRSLIAALNMMELDPATGDGGQEGLTGRRPGTTDAARRGAIASGVEAFRRNVTPGGAIRSTSARRA